MKSERRKIADRYRSAGLAENTVIKSYADRQYNEILARANADAERIRGKAEAEAITILNAAHAQDPEFYRVIRTLDSYRTILNERTTLVLSASSNLLKMLTEGIPEILPASGPRTSDPADWRRANPPNHRKPVAGGPEEVSEGDDAVGESNGKRVFDTDFDAETSRSGDSRPTEQNGSTKTGPGRKETAP